MKIRFIRLSAKITVFVVLCSVLFFRCKPETGMKIPKDIETVETEYIRFDHLVQEMDTNDILNSFRSLDSLHPIMTQLYFKRLVPLIRPGEVLEISPDVVKGFARAPLTQKFYHDIDSVYGDLSVLKNEMNQALSYYHFYFPSRDIPDVYTVMTECAYFPFIFSDEEEKDALGLSLELFLGSEYPYQRFAQQSPVFSNYNIHTLTPDHLVKKSMEVLLSDMIKSPRSDKLLNLMIDAGCRQFLIKQLMPWKEDHIMFDYSEKEMQWCIENEAQIWKYLASEGILYTAKDAMKYINPAPHTRGMSKDSPGRVVVWIGYRIVEEYVKRNDIVDLELLLNLPDAQTVLEEARYRPR